MLKLFVGAGVGSILDDEPLGLPVMTWSFPPLPSMRWLIPARISYAAVALVDRLWRSTEVSLGLGS